MKKTKILSTIGPASASRKVLLKMYQAGMNGIRINSAFGSLNQYKEIIKDIKMFLASKYERLIDRLSHNAEISQEERI